MARPSGEIDGRSGRCPARRGGERRPRARSAASGDWGLAGTKAGQHHSDLAADAAALEVLGERGSGVLSEESGLQDAERPLLVVVDPLDGSTNAAQGIPWFATSLCAVDADGPLAALVVNLVNGDRFEARRGEGAWRNGAAIGPSAAPTVRAGHRRPVGLPAAVAGLAAVPGARGGGPRPVRGGLRRARRLPGLQPRRPRRLGLPGRAAGLPGGRCGRDRRVLARPGAARRRDEKRTPVAAATPSLLDELVAARRSF